MKENFAIVNLSGSVPEAISAKVDFANKKINLSSSFEFSEFNLNSVLKKFFPFVFYPQSYNAVFILSPRDAAAYYDSVVLDRDEPKKNITENELDDLISKAVWKFFDINRARATKQLGLGEQELMLSDISVHDFKLDGHRVINPFRQSARRLEISLGQTFVNRTLLKRLLSILPKRVKRIFVFEGGAVGVHLLGHLEKKERFVFAETINERTNLFLYDKGKIFFSDYFDWGENSLYKGISLKLRAGVSESRLMVKKFLDGETSLNFSKNFKKIFFDEIITLVHGLKSGPGSANFPAIYLDFPFLRDFLKKGLKFKKVSAKMIIPVDSSEVFDSFGFELKNKSADGGKLSFLTATALMEIYFLPTSSYPLSLINRLAKRRMRWLMPNQ